MIGYEVNKGTIDSLSAEAVLGLRSAFQKVESIALWLADNPVPSGQPDPLISEFGYTADETYALRNFFGTFETVYTSNDSAWASGRLMTGLE